MKIGLIARADNSGLGIQTWEFYKHMRPAKTMVVDISKLNGNKIYPERYPDGIVIKGIPTDRDIIDFLDGLDAVFIAEAAYTPNLYIRSKALGVKTAVQYNYEFFDWFNPEMPKPDMLIAPSTWHYPKVDEWCKNNGVMHTYLHCPVNRELLPKRTIKQARTFLHIAGKSAAYDRNGTLIAIEASKYLKTDAQILVHFQGDQGLAHQVTNTYDDYLAHANLHGDPAKLTINKFEYPEYQDAYATGDVMILPRRYGGNCLPLNEALSVGMPVIMPDISPNNSFLPKEWLLPAYQINRFTPRTVIDIYGCNPEDLAEAIDRFYNLNEEQMEIENLKADALANTISWEMLHQKYLVAFEELCSQ